MIRFFVLISLVFLWAPLAQAAPKPRPQTKCFSAKDTRERIARYRLQNPLMLLRAAARRNRAQPLRSRLCRRGSLLIYQFVLLRRDGKVVRMNVNARTGGSISAKK